jgi:hypothetical protein
VWTNDPGKRTLCLSFKRYARKSAGNQEVWEQTVRSLQEQLRTTWERAVEKALFPWLGR